MDLLNEFKADFKAYQMGLIDDGVIWRIERYLSLIIEPNEIKMVKIKAALNDDELMISRWIEFNEWIEGNKLYELNEINELIDEIKWDTMDEGLLDSRLRLIRGFNTEYKNNNF
jgi:hypothetical protein